MKLPQNFFLSLLCLTLLWSFQAQANILDEDEENSLDQNSLNALGSELQELERNDSYSQIYLPQTPQVLPTPSNGEWTEESKLAQDSNDTENSDEIKRKEAAIMRDLEEHAKPVEGLTPPPETQAPQEIVKEEANQAPTEFKPRMRSR